MAKFARGARVFVAIGLALMALGLLGLLLMAWVEYLHTPDLSLVDAYWRGREPLTSVSVWTTLIGSTLALVAGVVVALIAGSWIRKLPRLQRSRRRASGGSRPWGRSRIPITTRLRR